MRLKEIGYEVKLRGQHGEARLEGTRQEVKLEGAWHELQWGGMSRKKRDMGW